MMTIAFSNMSDRELIDRTVRAVADERNLTAELLALIGECDARRLYLGEGCSSLFAYCTQVLHLSEHAAYHRIESARAARQFPIILDLIADGAVTLTTVAMLRRHLTPENHKGLLTAASRRTKREVEHQIATLSPKPAPNPLIRRLPAPALPPPPIAMSAATKPSLPGPAAAEAYALSATSCATPLPAATFPSATTVVLPALMPAKVAALSADRSELPSAQRGTAGCDAHRS